MEIQLSFLILESRIRPHTAAPREDAGRTGVVERIRKSAEGLDYVLAPNTSMCQKAWTAEVELIAGNLLLFIPSGYDSWGSLQRARRGSAPFEPASIDYFEEKQKMRGQVLQDLMVKTRLTASDGCAICQAARIDATSNL
jgi:hypothetical protein